MLEFNMFFEKVFQAENDDKGIGGIQLCFFKLPYCIYSMLKPKKKHTPTNQPPETKIPEVFSFCNYKKKS